MNLSEFAFRMIFIFIPGLIAFSIVDQLTFQKESKTQNLISNSLTYGFICYLVYYFVFNFIPSKFRLWNVSNFYFAEVLTNSQAKLNFEEIVLVTLLAVPIGLSLSALINHKVLYKLANKLKISNKVDDIGVWNLAFDSSSNDWVIIRDNQNDLMYQGWIESVSDGLEIHDILLRDVKVYRHSDGTYFYSVPRIYLALSQDNLNIEFPSWEFTTTMNNDIVINEPGLSPKKEDN
jgi:Family of unknown function (DUF6338)